MARLARILVEEEREMEMEEGVESVAMPRDDDDGVDGSVPPPPPETKNPDAKFLYDFAKAFVRTARQQFPKTVAESDDYAMQARYQASRCARSADATLSLDWFFQFMDELIAKEEMENGGGGNHYNSRMYKGSHAYRPDMYATNTGTTTNEEQTAMIPVEDLFLLRARSYYYANRVQAREHRVRLGHLLPQSGHGAPKPRAWRLLACPSPGPAACSSCRVRGCARSGRAARWVGALQRLRAARRRPELLEEHEVVVLRAVAAQAVVLGKEGKELARRAIIADRGRRGMLAP